MPEGRTSSQITPGPDWNPAPPERIPRLTAWPAAVGLGVTLLFWGLISSFLLSGAGAVLFIIAMGGWIHEIRHERAS